MNLIKFSSLKIIHILETEYHGGSIRFVCKKLGFSNNKVIQTILNHIDVTIHKKSESNLDLYVRRSFAKHLWDWLKDSASLV